jgi:pimeloyl-ACP methyl ester carboxylesterase
MVIDLCEKDPACNAKFPFRKDFETVMARLTQGPVEVEVKHPETGKPIKVKIPREVAGEGLRAFLYNADGDAALPLVFHEAAAGDWTHLGQAIVDARYGLINGIVNGLFFSVTCSEDAPSITKEMIAKRTAGSFLRDDRVSRQMAACDLWPHAKIDPSDRAPFKSDAPVLVINGQMDPVTPPDFGRRVVANLSNSLFLEVPYQGHGINVDCPVDVAQSFIDHGSLKGLDTSCIAQVKQTPFVLEAPKAE